MHENTVLTHKVGGGGGGGGGVGWGEGSEHTPGLRLRRVMTACDRRAKQEVAAPAPVWYRLTLSNTLQLLRAYSRAAQLWPPSALEAAVAAEDVLDLVGRLRDALTSDESSPKVKAQCKRRE